MLSVGSTAPDFTLPNQDGEEISLSDFQGQQVVLYFYPRADTPGCTKEACNFRDNWEQFEKQNMVVLGISDDPVEDIADFKQKYNLPFDLLSDSTGEVASTYESYGEREIQGELQKVTHRNTYIIDSEGRIKYTFKNVSPDQHAEEILETIN
ncbi:MAG: thioredoxin-dependent thiol peroxidase [Halobacteriaceae archaeon]